MKTAVNLLWLLCLIFPQFQLTLQADDGMWMPDQIADLKLAEAGLQIDPKALYSKDGIGLINAIVNLSGGTGSFVSDSGLILTNHHVAYSTLQRASTVEHDYLQYGFIASSREQEIPAPGLNADVLLNYQEVTETILRDIKAGMNELERYTAIDRAIKRLVAKVEKEGPDIRAKVASICGNKAYFLYRFKRIQDIRIVFAPPQDLGNFGGEIDNWMWPRHTADFTFLRAYVSRKGVGVPHQKENIPYRPQFSLKLSTSEINEGDFTFVMGYPGQTYRNYTLPEFDYALWLMENRRQKYQEIINFFEEASQDNREIEIKYSSLLRRLHNSMKNYSGKLEGLTKYNIGEKKIAQQQQMRTWLVQNQSPPSRLDELLQKFAQLINEKSGHQQKMDKLGDWVHGSFGPSLLHQAHLILRTVQERQKPDIDREIDFQERQFPTIQKRVELANRSFDKQVDQAYFTKLLLDLLKMPETELPSTFRQLLMDQNAESLKEYAARVYQNTGLADEGRRMELLGMNLEALQKVNDPMIDLAALIETELAAFREKGKILQQRENELKKEYSLLVQKVYPDQLAPDANGTIRFTYGYVNGYQPADAVYYQPQTTLKGVIEKDRGRFPFHVPEKLRMLHLEKDFGSYADGDLQDIPVCFLNTTNVTGGNSGSPTLNARGEVIGIIFDMTYQSIIGDYYIIPELQRTLSVDIRYVLFLIDRYSGATNLLRELH